MTKSTKILIINKKRGGFSAAQKELAKTHQSNFGIVSIKDFAADDAPEYIYVECDPEKRKAQIALAGIAKAKESKAALALDVEVAPAIPQKLPKLIERVSSDGSRSWGFSAK